MFNSILNGVPFSSEVIKMMQRYMPTIRLWQVTPHPIYVHSVLQQRARMYRSITQTFDSWSGFKVCCNKSSMSCWIGHLGGSTETTQLTRNWQTFLSKSSSMSIIARRTYTAISSLLRTNVASWNPKIRIIILDFRLHQQVINGGNYILPRNLHIRRYHRLHFVFNVTLLIRSADQ